MCLPFGQPLLQTNTLAFKRNYFWPVTNSNFLHLGLSCFFYVNGKSGTLQKVACFENKHISIRLPEPSVERCLLIPDGATSAALRYQQPGDDSLLHQQNSIHVYKWGYIFKIILIKSVGNIVVMLLCAIFCLVPHVTTTSAALSVITGWGFFFECFGRGTTEKSKQNYLWDTRGSLRYKLLLK